MLLLRGAARSGGVGSGGRQLQDAFVRVVCLGFDDMVDGLENMPKRVTGAVALVA